MLQRAFSVEELLSKFAAVRCGAKSISGYSRQAYIDRLTWMRELLKFDPTPVSRRAYERISYTLETLKLDDSNGKIRKQPYCVVLTGYPGSGKSTFALQLAVECMKRRYGEASPGDIVTLNETDEFQSEFRTSHKVVIFDDLGAESQRPGTVNPWRKVIDFVNNVRKTALNPNVDMKGNVYIEPDLVIITTNLHSCLGVTNWMKAPGAIFRRLKSYIVLADGFTECCEVVPEYDSNQVAGVYSRSILVKRIDPKADKMISRNVMINDLVDRFDEHMLEQQSFVDEANSIFTDLAERGPVEAFLYDMVYPWWPKKPLLDKCTEAVLPLHTKMWRKLCLEDKQALVCMTPYTRLPTDTEPYTPQGETLPSGMKEHDLQDGAFISQSGDPSKKLDFEKYLDINDCYDQVSDESSLLLGEAYFDENQKEDSTPKVVNKESDWTPQERYILKIIDWDLYHAVRPSLPTYFSVHQDGFCTDSNAWPKRLLPTSRATFHTTVMWTKEELDELYERFKTRTTRE
jgi:energy-coupling factor transporter ATP-binding protein EcfA2